MDEVVKYLLTQWGLPGAVLAAMGWWLLRTQATAERDRRESGAKLDAAQAKLDAEHAARLDDAKANTKAMLDLSNQVHQTVDRLSEIAEKLSRPPTTGT